MSRMSKEGFGSDLKIERLPQRPSLWLLMGPAFVWAAVAQGSGELIWWPYFAAKYGTALLGIILPASILQIFVNQEIVRYTALTGEGIWSGFKRFNKIYTLFLFLLAFICFLWFGGYASAGGTALFSLTKFPFGFSERSGSLFWAYLTIAVFTFGLVFSKVIYHFIEKFMKTVLVLTLSGLALTIMHPLVLKSFPEFARAFFNPLTFHFPASWEVKDASILVTGIAYAGMGGFLNLMYSYWMRDKGIGMAKYVGKLTSPVTGKTEAITSTGYRFADNSENKKEWQRWDRYLKIDNLTAVGLNTVTMLMTTLLSFAILFPRRLYPTGWKIVTVQAEIFGLNFGQIGKAVFLVAAALFLVNTWLGLADGVARQFADFTFTFKKAQKKSFRFWYYLWLAWLVFISCLTITLAQPGTLITIAGVISIFAFVLFLPVLWFLNYRRLPRIYPAFVRPGKLTEIFLGITWIFYLGTAVWFLLVIFS